MTSQEVTVVIRKFLAPMLDINALADTDDIFQKHYVNSMFALQLVQFVEREFQIAITDDDLELENFSSVKNLASFVMTKT